MVVGNGLVANSLKNVKWDSKYLFFASGVSNSKSARIEDYTRERQLILSEINLNPEKHLVYFSTCSVLDGSNVSDYVKHKREIESLIIEKVPNYVIVRISNLVGKSRNPHTILNYLVNSVRTNQEFELWEGAKRNLLDVDDFVDVLQIILPKLNNSDVLNIYNPKSIEVLNLVNIIEGFLDVSANYRIRKFSNHFDITESLETPNYLISYKNFYKEGYIKNLLAKYY